jgi:processive 1,2-diacylglycerol beta-glucosyltransferase
MKLLIISSPGGAGHVQVANALTTKAADYSTIAAVRHINIASFLPHTTNTLLFDSYNWSAQFFPLWWRAVYTLTNNSFGTWCYKHLAQILRYIHKQKLQKLDQFIETFQPDWILCTHPVQRFFLTHSDTRHIGMVFTDYDAHTAWIQDSRDTLFVPTKDILIQTLRKGAQQTQCVISGIPVHPVFFEEKNTQTLQHNYNIDITKKTVLILTGGHGLYNPTTYIKTLNTSNQPLNIIVIAGKNTYLQKKLQYLTVEKKHSYQIIGWTDSIDEYMRTANHIITKPGGVTISECLVLQKPMILVSPIPGHEEANRRALCHTGVALYAKKSADILNYINRTPVKQKKIPDASQIILDYITHIKY